ncbi:MAG TPA: metal-dependent hydrolase [Leucothrix mucor]|nr:metal-dependent hydrolase [Leucothrix mucor]
MLPYMSKQTSHSIKIRQPKFDFERDIPRYWFNDNPVITHNFNGYNLLFPEFERFFVRSVMYFRKEIKAPQLLKQIKGFTGQEIKHAQAHEDYFHVLERQGYKITRFLRWYKRYAAFIERMATPKLRLSLTAAAEHYTATIAGIVLSHPELLENVDPTMRKLVIWHSAEEVEHRSVAFDVMQAVEVSNAMRIMAFLMTSFDMLLWSTLSTVMFLWQDRISPLKAFKYKRQYGKKFKGINRQMRRGLLAYFRKDFHPSDFDYLKEAHQLLKQEGIDE